MKKPLIAALALSLSVFSFAQKKELKAAEKAVKATNFSEARNILKSIEPTGLDDNSKAKYNYLRGLALYANGAGTYKQLKQGIKSLNRSRKVYKKEVEAFKNEMLGSVVAKANKAYEDKEFATASINFEKAYNLKEKDTFYLYYSASSAINVPDYDRALPLYERLKKIKYTGIEVKYFAVQKNTNLKALFPTKRARNKAVQKGTHHSPSIEKTKNSESKRAEIVKNVALIYIYQGDNDKAIQAIKDARVEDPDDLNLILAEANIYFKTNNLDKFKEVLNVALQKDPENPELLYNLGVVSAESKQYDEAKKYYEKTIALDPKYINAYINMAVVVLGEEEAIIKEMNNLGTSSADNRRYDVLLKKRKGLYNEAVPYLSKALEINPKSLNAATTLMNIYGALGETAKQKELKTRIEAIKSEQ